MERAAEGQVRRQEGGLAVFFNAEAGAEGVGEAPRERWGRWR